MSVLDFLHLSSSLSMRAYGRIGALSTLDFLHIGSTVWNAHWHGYFGTGILQTVKIARF